MRVVAIIPARGGSKGIPHKNVMGFCGKPLIVWSIEQAQQSKRVDEVYVSSDNPRILRVAKRAKARGIVRPAALATDTATTEAALIHALDMIETDGAPKVDALVLLQATSPLRLPGDIDRAVREFFKQKADSLFSAALLEDFCIWQKEPERWTSMTFDYKNRGRRQDRAPLYLENGSIYVVRPEVLRKRCNRLGGKIITSPMAFWQSYEIDSLPDIEICEYFMKNKVVRTNKKDR